MGKLGPNDLFICHITMIHSHLIVNQTDLLNLASLQGNKLLNTIPQSWPTPDTQAWSDIRNIDPNNNKILVYA